MHKKIKKIINRNYFEYFFLALIFIGAFFVRVYRINDLLGFYYDQGRDGLVIWDLIYNGKFFLIGPTTGLAGIFRGPYYYYLIAPFYLLGKGNPIYPSVFLSFLTVLSNYILYNLVKKAQGKSPAIIAVILSSFSYYLVIASRWLSNPTPMFLLSVLLIFGMFRVIENKKFGWEIIAFISGLSLFNFGSSGEFFYFPAIFIFIIWQWKNKPSLKRFFISSFIFFTTFAPLLFFDIRHDGILRNNILNSFVSEKSFIFPTKYLFENRISFYYEIFSKLIFHTRGKYEIILLISILLLLALYLKEFLRNKYLKTIFIIIVSPLIGLLFFSGNNGVLYEYYMTGYFLIIIFLIATILGKIWKNQIGKVFVIIFLSIFLKNNLDVINFKLSDQVDSEGSISLKNELQIVDWVFDNSKGEHFNVDVYVPPVIPYAYDYLFLWQSKVHSSDKLRTERESLLYTIYENDTQHPDRFIDWINRQSKIGKIVEEKRFGGITVQRRIRI